MQTLILHDVERSTASGLFVQVQHHLRAQGARCSVRMLGQDRAEVTVLAPAGLADALCNSVVDLYARWRRATTGDCPPTTRREPGNQGGNLPESDW